MARSAEPHCANCPLFLSHWLSPRTRRNTEKEFIKEKETWQKNNTKLRFLRQGTKTEEGSFVELDESILRRPKEKKKESLEKEIFLDSFSLPVVR